MKKEQKLLTVGEIARQLNCPIHRVEYRIRNEKIACIAKAGKGLRIFSKAVRDWLKDIFKIEAQLEAVNNAIAHIEKGEMQNGGIGDNGLSIANSQQLYDRKHSLERRHKHTLNFRRSMSSFNGI